MALRKDNKVKSNFSKITISLASPETILQRSAGEVLKPETIDTAKSGLLLAATTLLNEFATLKRFAAVDV